MLMTFEGFILDARIKDTITMAGDPNEERRQIPSADFTSRHSAGRNFLLDHPRTTMASSSDEVSWRGSL